MEMNPSIVKGPYDAKNRQIPLDECKKVYLQRDYSHPVGIRFFNEFPDDLTDYVEKQIWSNFIDNLNRIYSEAEKVNKRTCMENLIGLITCYLSRLFCRTLWDEKLEEAAKLIDDYNTKYFQKNGIHISNPIEKGFRVIEVSLLDEPMPKKQENNVNNNSSNLLTLQPR